MTDPSRAFDTTRWSLVARAADLATPTARQALGELCQAYWKPLYGFARHRGESADDAADLVQGFLTHLLETSGLRGADPNRGRFRSYLLGAFRHYLSNERRRQQALRRGGGTSSVPFDPDAFEESYDRSDADHYTPEVLYERQWARTVLERTLGGLRREYAAAGKEEIYAALEDRLIDRGQRGEQRRAAEALGMREGAVRVAAHRLRRRFRERLRCEVAATVESEAAVDEELAYLVRILGGSV